MDTRQNTGYWCFTHALFTQVQRVQHRHRRDTNSKYNQITSDFLCLQLKSNWNETAYIGTQCKNIVTKVYGRYTGNSISPFDWWHFSKSCPAFTQKFITNQFILIMSHTQWPRKVQPGCKLVISDFKAIHYRRRY